MRFIIGFLSFVDAVITVVASIFGLTPCNPQPEPTPEPTRELAYRELSESVNEYYINVDTTLRGEEFKSNLNTTISNGYVKKSYADAYKILAEADEDPFDSNKIICNYTGLSILKNLNTTKAWNREHTFPKSHGFNDQKFEAYSDCHHLMATGNLINSKRGNKDFDEVTADKFEDRYGNKWTNTIFEPRDEIKGDVARMIFYMTVRYNDDVLNLNLAEQGIDKETTMGCLSTLIKWHYQDPVSDKEIKRNEVVYSYQNNRNPFIDHPEWVNFLYETTDYVNETVDSAKVFNVIDKIDSLPATVTLENQEEINNIYSLVNELNNQERLYVNNYSKLTEANTLVKYLSNNRSLSDYSIYLDFACASVTDAEGKTGTSYMKNTTIVVNDYAWKASEAAFLEAATRIGTNGKKEVTSSSLSEFGVAVKGSYMTSEFSVVNMTQIDLDIAGGSSNYKLYVFGKTSDGYTKLFEEKYKEDLFEVKLDEAFSGQIVVAIGNANNAKMIINSIGIKTK